jgi:3-keto-disaccharide hydrolase
MRALCVLALLLGLSCCAWGAAGTPAGGDGWVTLFNGRDLTGWTQMNGGQWKVEGGVLKYAGVGDGWLRSNESYGDFHLILEWRYPVAEGQHDAGLFFRAGTEGMPFPSRSFQMNMGPDDNWGSVGGVPGTVKRPDLMHKPGGDWNTYELILVGDKGLALINGQRAWDAAGFTRATRGHIGFQNEGYPWEIRTVKIRRLGRR